MSSPDGHVGGGHSRGKAGGGMLRDGKATLDGWGGVTENYEGRQGLPPVELLDDGALFDMELPPPVTLSDRFGVPPFSVLDRRSGVWQDRRRRWLTLGIRSELGRSGGLIAEGDSGYVIACLPADQREAALAARGTKVDLIPGAGGVGGAYDRSREGGTLHKPNANPGGSGRGAWRGTRADGSTGTFDPKYETKPGTPSNLIPGGAGTGSAYDRSQESGLLYTSASGKDPTYYYQKQAAEAVVGRELSLEEFEANHYVPADTLQSGTSIFDPVLCELVYRWYSAPGHRVLDPFAGGSVRGVVASVLERHYLGIDLRGEQIAANEQQREEILGTYRKQPKWRAGDSREILQRVPAETADLIFSCPPYADLEVYSDDPRDLSSMEYKEFCEAHAEIIDRSCRALKQDRFACWVISDVRDPKGNYRGLVAETIRAFAAAGLHYYNDAVILDPVGSAAVRAARIFLGGRKLTRMHQHLLIFLKGDSKRATKDLPRDIIAVE